MTGIAATYFTGKRGREHAERLASQAYEQQRILASDARIQERLGEAYLQLLVMVEQSGAWAQAVKPIVDTDPPRPVPPLPEIDTQIAVEAATNAFASAPVRKALRAWREVMTEILRQVQLIDLEKEARSRGEHRGVDFGSPYRGLTELRPKESEARERLSDHVADELGHRLLTTRSEVGGLATVPEAGAKVEREGKDTEGTRGTRGGESAGYEIEFGDLDGR